MASVKLTKNELKKQKDDLKRYTRYLPTLQLKKQQLQMVIMSVNRRMKELERNKEEIYQGVQKWIAVFGENVLLPRSGRLEQLISVEEILRKQGNIAGVAIPVFEGVTFATVTYDLFETPVWIDSAVEVLKQMAELDAHIDILNQQIRLLEHELRITTQRVNLFEKVKIPQTREQIRKIRIYLGDQQTAAVVRGKIAKKKLEKVS
jgi:V/A-type H+/Na+-transporting ATPase subunit D